MLETSAPFGEETPPGPEGGVRMVRGGQEAGGSALKMSQQHQQAVAGTWGGEVLPATS